LIAAPLGVRHEEERMTTEAVKLEFDYSKYGFRDEENYTFKSGKGLTPQVIKELSGMKGEPEWMLQRRMKAYDTFLKKPMPLVGTWANRLR
jgi:Fe-S cluster assembly protein SufB